MRIALTMAALGLALLACQHFERAGDCRALADAVNPQLSLLAINYSKFNPVSAEEFRDASKKYDVAVAHLDASHFKNPEMTSLAMQMRENLKATARSCDRIALGLVQQELATNGPAYKDLETQRQRHASLVATVDRACQQQ